jgi:hypothetical protein
MIAALLMLATAQLNDLPLPSTLVPPRQTVAISISIRALEADPDTLNMFRGYDDFLHEDPSLFLAEQDKLKILPHESYRILAENFERELFGSSIALDRFAAFQYASLANPNVAAAIDRLTQSKLDRRSSRDEFLLGIRYLQAHLEDDTLFRSLTRRPQFLPRDLESLRILFKSEFPLRDEMLEQFAAIQSTTAAPTSIQRWWNLAYDAGTPLGRSYIQLEDYLLKNPQRYRAWRRWAQAWSAYPKAWAWTQYLHADMTARTQSSAAYTAFLRAYFDEPDLRQTMRDRWNGKFGPPSTFPPEADPPRISRNHSRTTSPENPKSPRQGVALPHRPAKLDVARPAAPSRPARPTLTKPLEPDRLSTNKKANK